MSSVEGMFLFSFHDSNLQEVLLNLNTFIIYVYLYIGLNICIDIDTHIYINLLYSLLFAYFLYAECYIF